MGSHFASYDRTDAGMYYADQRFYRDGVGRFLSADPYQSTGIPVSPASWNKYGYVTGDPVNLSDPLGLDPSLGASCRMIWVGGFPQVICPVEVRAVAPLGLPMVIGGGARKIDDLELPMSIPTKAWEALLQESRNCMGDANAFGDALYSALGRNAKIDLAIGVLSNKHADSILGNIVVAAGAVGTGTAVGAAKAGEVGAIVGMIAGAVAAAVGATQNQSILKHDIEEQIGGLLVDSEVGAWLEGHGYSSLWDYFSQRQEVYDKVRRKKSDCLDATLGRSLEVEPIVGPFE